MPAYETWQPEEPERVLDRDRGRIPSFRHGAAERFFPVIGSLAKLNVGSKAALVDPNRISVFLAQSLPPGREIALGFSARRP